MRFWPPKANRPWPATFKVVDRDGNKVGSLADTVEQKDPIYEMVFRGEWISGLKPGGQGGPILG